MIVHGPTTACALLSSDACAGVGPQRRTTDLAKKLASTHVDPAGLDAFNSCRLIPLVKDVDGVRPIGIGEVLHRIVAKAIVRTVNGQVVV